MLNTTVRFRSRLPDANFECRSVESRLRNRVMFPFYRSRVKREIICNSLTKPKAKELGLVNNIYSADLVMLILQQGDVN